MVNAKNITYSYNAATGNVLENICFDIEDGQCLGILGNNGTGKSTLLKCLDRICRTKGATVLVDGENVFKMSGSKMAQSVAYVPQASTAADMTVFDTVLLGRKPYIKWDATEEDHRIVSEVIHEMGLDDYTLRTVSQLSGGEAQKVMLARALAQEPRFLMLDEPTSSLDPHNQHEVLRTVKRIAREHNISVAIVIHDLNLALRYCDRFLFLKDSKVFAYGGRETMTPENIESVYQIHTHVIDYMGIPVIVPFPDESLEYVHHSKNHESEAKSHEA